MTDETVPMIDKVRAILADFTEVKLIDGGSFWTISGFHHGIKKHLGSTSDRLPSPLDLAREIARVANEDPPILASGAQVVAPVAPRRPDMELEAAPDIAAMKGILRERIQAEAIRRSGISVGALARATELAAIINDSETSQDVKRKAELEARQIGEKASSAAPFEAARARKDSEIIELKTAADVFAYDVKEGWPA